MSQCCDYEDINFYVINVFYGIVIAVYFLPFKKNHPVNKHDNQWLRVAFSDGDKKVIIKVRGSGTSSKGTFRAFGHYQLSRDALICSYSKVSAGGFALFGRNQHLGVISILQYSSIAGTQ